MREILFRGKRDKRYGEGWTYGVPYIDHEGDCIMATHCSKRVVDPDTVGQYIGRTDKNRKKIFEGDIIKHYIKNSEFVKTYVVAWENRLSKFVGKYIGDEYYGKKYAYAELHENLIYEVIGNIHDNPELLGGA